MAAASPPPTPAGTCCNCGTKLVGTYCHECGQHDANARRPGGFLSEAVEELTDYDSKIFRTLGALLWRPGQLSLAYVHGQRARYAPPLRVFINIGVAVLLLMGLVGQRAIQVESTAAPGTSIMDQPLDSLTRQDYEASLARAQARGDTARVRKLLAQGPSKPRVGLGFHSDFQALLQHNLERSTLRQLINSGLDKLPIAMFLLLPLAAALHWGFYQSRHRHYVTHLVFNLHVHAFAFLVLIPALLVNWLRSLSGNANEWLEVTTTLLQLVVPVYYLRAARRFYAVRWSGVLWRSVLLGMLYFVLVTFAIAGLIIMAIWLV